MTIYIKSNYDMYDMTDPRWKPKSASKKKKPTKALVQPWSLPMQLRLKQAKASGRQAHYTCKRLRWVPFRGTIVRRIIMRELQKTR